MEVFVPDILCIGHVCHDMTPDGFVLGGTASYCSLVARKLGLSPAVVTSYGPDFLFASTFGDAQIPLHVVESMKTTIFQNIYKNNHRDQYILERASDLTIADIPGPWLASPIIKLCLIADEFDPAALSSLDNSFVTATIQGWLRGWNTDGKVFPKPMDWNKLKHLDAVLMSSDDIKGFEDIIPTLVSMIDLVVITNGERDAIVYEQGVRHDFPVFPVMEVDPTGAGDVFAVSFLINYKKTRSIRQATTFAHCAASIIVEGNGIDNLANIDLIEERIAQYNKLFLD